MDIDVQQVIKWILIVLLAGFIGQFGKILAESIVEKMKEKKKNNQIENKSTENALDEFSQYPAKTSTAESPPSLSREEMKMDKKALKIIAKQKKKETK